MWCHLYEVHNTTSRFDRLNTKQCAESLRDQLIEIDMSYVQLVKSKNYDWYSVTVGRFVCRSMLSKSQDQFAQMSNQAKVLSD